MPVSKNFGEIPIIDLEGLNASNSQELAEQLRNVCHSIGFFVVINHGIPKEIMEQTFAINLSSIILTSTFCIEKQLFI